MTVSKRSLSAWITPVWEKVVLPSLCLERSYKSVLNPITVICVVDFVPDCFLSYRRCGESSQTGWWVTQAGCTSGTTRWGSGNMSPSGPMRSPWF